LSAIVSWPFENVPVARPISAVSVPTATRRNAPSLSGKVSPTLISSEAPLTSIVAPVADPVG
jgi:hypothetical protein